MRLLLRCAAACRSLPLAPVLLQRQRHHHHAATGLATASAHTTPAPALAPAHAPCATARWPALLVGAVWCSPAGQRRPLSTPTSKRGAAMTHASASAPGGSGLPATMRAMRVADPGGPEAMVLDTALPLPAPGAGEVVVRNEAIGVNFIDTYHRSGLYPVEPKPFTPGVEGAGVVVAVGPGVEAPLVPGDRVAYVTRPPGGSYAEYCCVAADKVAPLPHGLPVEKAAAAMIQGMTALSLVTLAYEVRGGDVVLVHAAAGGTGRLLAQLAAAAGAHVIGTASTEAKAEVARRTGCRDVIMYTQQDLVSEVMRLTGGRGVRVVYDGVGRATFDASLACLGKLGWMVSFGNASGKVADVDILRLSRNNVRLMRPALWDFIATKEEFSDLAGRTLSAVASGQLDVLIGGTLPLAKAAEAHTMLQGRATVGKLLLAP